MKFFLRIKKQVYIVCVAKCAEIKTEVRSFDRHVKVLCGSAVRMLCGNVVRECGVMDCEQVLLKNRGTLQNVVGGAMKVKVLIIVKGCCSIGGSPCQACSIVALTSPSCLRG